MPNTAKSPKHKAETPPAPISPFTVRMLKALQRLHRERQPHPCGGFTTDDMQWQMGTAFTAQETLYEALDELAKARLIRFAGFDDEDAIGTCYELTDSGKEAA
jgi:hypothetical protein